MEKYKEALLALFGLLICAIVGLSLHSCAHQSKTQEEMDSLTANYASQEPTWADPESYVKATQAWAEKTRNDSIIRSIPEETLLTIAKVVRKTHETFTDKDIIAEYNAHKDIYSEVQHAPEYEKEVTRVNSNVMDTLSYDTMYNGVKVHVTEYTKLK